MKFTSHFSSSKHNLYEIVADNGKRLLVECGVPWATLQEALDYNLEELEGCLISHSHQDHCKAVREVIRAGMDVYAGAETFEALGIATGRLCHAIADTEIRQLQSFDVLAFEVQHDVPCMGFVVHEIATHQTLLFATDFFCLEQEFQYPFAIIAMALSYDIHVLQARVDAKDIDEALAKRLLTSHPSKHWVKGYLAGHVNLSKCREIVLLHMSGSNLDKEATRREIEHEFFITTRVGSAL